MALGVIVRGGDSEERAQGEISEARLEVTQQIRSRER